MSEWKKVRLGEITSIKTGKLNSCDAVEDGCYPFFTCAENPLRINTAAYDSESVLVAGNCTPYVNYYKGKFNAYQRTYIITPTAEDLFGRWLFYWMRQEIKMMIHRQQGSVEKYFVLSDFTEEELTLPPLATQRRIAAVLSSLDDKIENNRKICANLEAQAQAIFKSWFVDFEPFGGKMPQGWNVCSFDQICKPRNEKGSPQLLNMYAVTNTGILPRAQIFKKDLAFSGTACKIMHKGDLVFGMSRSILNWGVMKDEIGGVSSAYHIYSVTRGIPSNYIESYISAHIREFTTLIKPASREGQGFDADKLMTMELGFPNKEILEAYYDLVEPILQLIAIRKREVYSLSLLRDALLPKLMSGEIDVEKVKVA